MERERKIRTNNERNKEIYKEKERFTEKGREKDLRRDFHDKK